MLAYHRLVTLAAVAIVMAVSGGSPALAEWHRAESPKFIVYSNGREAALREYVQKLETYDYILRVRLGLPIDAFRTGNSRSIWLTDGVTFCGFIPKAAKTSSAPISLRKRIFSPSPSGARATTPCCTNTPTISCSRTLTPSIRAG
jgi:hypothetical protein